MLQRRLTSTALALHLLLSSLFLKDRKRGTEQRLEEKFPMREKKGKARTDADGHVLVPPRPRQSSRALSFAQRRKMMARRWFDVSELDRSFARAERGKAKEGARRRAELMRICREGLWSVMAPG
jgi:hypothetical protein